MYESFFSHGFPGGSAARDAQLYERLALRKDCTAAEIKKAYRGLAKRHHPDKGGDSDKFRDIQEAYNVLSDENKRAHYDRGTATAVPPHWENRIRLRVRLEDLFRGAEKSITVSRAVPCTTCAGKGGTVFTDCGACQGKGHLLGIRHLGPGMVQHVRTHCAACTGTGRAPTTLCGTCLGAKTLDTKRTHRVQILPGMSHGTEIRLPTEDVTVVLDCMEHDVYRPLGAHLFCTQELSLVEALTGFHFSLLGLDGTRRHVVSEQNTVYTHGCMRVLRGAGMPPSGDLYIEFRVRLPQALDPSTRQALRALLLPNPSAPAPADASIPTALAQGERERISAGGERQQQHHGGCANQ